jgi:hypothetical protein
MAYNYTGAFCGFIRGATPGEIAEEFKIPLKSLTAKIRQEGWRGLANRMAGRIAADSTPTDDALSRIEANRAKNYEIAAKLREHVIEMVIALCAGTLRIKKQFQYKGQIVEYEAEPGPADWLNIAAYARTAFDLTYRSLGDFGANGGYKADASPGTPPPAQPMTTIVLPSVISRPREERGAEIDCAPVEPGRVQGITGRALLPAPPEAATSKTPRY